MNRISDLGGFRLARRTLSIVAFLGLWAILAEVNKTSSFVNPTLFPSPSAVAKAGWSMRHLVVIDVVASLRRSLGGFVIAALLGTFVGVLVGYVRLAQDLLEPLVELFRPIPALAFLPLFILWFGIGEASKIYLIAYACFFPVFVNTQEGVRYVDPVMVRAALSLGARPRQIFTRIIIRAALPNIMTGLRLAMALSLIVLVAAELVAADSGIGFRIQDSRLVFRVDRMIFGAALLGVMGFTFNSIFRFAERYLLRWKPRVEQSRG